MKLAVVCLGALLGACTAPSSSLPPAAARGAAFVEASEGDVATLVKAALGEARAHGRRLIVYTGATWCEPCQAFHRAVERGELAGLEPAVTLLEFDLDHDGARLRAAGYQGQYVPLLVVPGDDGRATARLTTGVQKGGDYVKQVEARLTSLLRSGGADR
jgi:hypothetical protein